MLRKAKQKFQGHFKYGRTRATCTGNESIKRDKKINTSRLGSEQKKSANTFQFKPKFKDFGAFSATISSRRTSQLGFLNGIETSDQCNCIKSKLLIRSSITLLFRTVQALNRRFIKRFHVEAGRNSANRIRCRRKRKSFKLSQSKLDIKS